jgi:hypothetical protein
MVAIDGEMKLDLKNHVMDMIKEHKITFGQNKKELCFKSNFKYFMEEAENKF